MSMNIKEVKELLNDLMGRFSKSSNAKELLTQALEFVESQQQEIERLKYKLTLSSKCQFCGTKAKGTGDFCVIFCKYNMISDLNNEDLDNYEPLD
jgi:DNA-binding transcriptional MerR regulator